MPIASVRYRVPLIACVSLALLAFSFGCSRNESPADKSQPNADAREAHESHDGHTGHDAHPTPSLPAGQLWPTDEPLRAAMEHIRSAVEKSASAYDAKQLQVRDSTSLAATVEENITYMIANCKLAPNPDAALHALIGRMLNAAAALKKDPASDAGVPQLLAVLHDYQATFDHPGWNPVAHVN